jgi:hypothetical protein
MEGKSIGLCLSGGGHRASIFALGALLYLVDAGRHSDVKAISSVSGGSLTNGFLAAQSRPLHKMSCAEFDQCAANWARQIAGSPAWWGTAIIGHALLFIAWMVAVGISWDWLPSPSWPISYVPHWWEPQLIYLAAVCLWATLIGRRSGGTLWAWWGTWLYLGTLLPAFVLLAFVWWSPLSWAWRVPIAIIAAGIIGVRPYIAGRAFRSKEVCSKRLLSEIHHTPRHIFCATEMHEGRHAFFSRDFIYSRAAGLGQPADLALGAAVQASANFPVAFPYRIFLLRKRYEFKLWNSLSLGRRIIPSLLLSDGGVQDNTGVTWFSEASERNAFLREFFHWCSSSNNKSRFGWLDERDCERIKEQLAVMEDLPALLIVVNSSFPKGWNQQRYYSIPVLGEITALLSVQRVMYEYRGREQSRQLHHSFFHHSVEGVVVSIEQLPQQLFGVFQDLDRTSMPAQDQLRKLRDLGISDLPQELLDRYRHRVQAALQRQIRGPDYETEADSVAARSRELAEQIEQLKAQIEQKAQKDGLDFLRPQVVKLESEILRLTFQKFQLERKLSGKELDLSLNSLRQRNQEAGDTRASSIVATTFRPLGIEATTALLRHGYLNCMNLCYLLQEDFPLFDDPPSPDELRQLVAGVARNRRPAASFTGPSVSSTDMSTPAV